MGAITLEERQAALDGGAVAVLRGSRHASLAAALGTAQSSGKGARLHEQAHNVAVSLAHLSASDTLRGRDSAWGRERHCVIHVGY